MSLPENILSVPAVPTPYLFPDSQERELLIDFELGGVALNDPSQGLLVQRWTLTLVGDDVTIEPDSGGTEVLFTFTGITEISLAFDQNMHPFVTYIRDGDAWYWWFDPLVPGQVHAQMALDVKDTRCTIDDKRSQFQASSDIILAYKKGDGLFMRIQRDRFTIEYDLLFSTPVPFHTFGMTENLRVKFEFRGF